VDLQRLMVDAIGMLAIPEGIRVEQDFPPDGPWIYGDYGHLRDLFYHLLENAVEAMPGGGTLVVAGEVLDSKARVTEVEWQTSDTSALDLNQTVLKSALQQAGQNPVNYNITDWNIRRVLLEQKPRLVTLAMGLLIILMLLRYLLRKIRNVYSALKEGSRYEYLGKVLKLKVDMIRGVVLKIIVVLGVIILIWLGCVFKPYIPPRYIPDELINTAYYFNLFESGIREGIANQGYIPSHSERILRQTEALTSWLLLLGLVGGLPVLYSGLAKLKTAGIGPERIMVHGGLGMVGAVLGMVVIAGMMGILLVVDLRSVLIIWGLVFGKTFTTINS
jgi:hypothetical protein